MSKFFINLRKINGAAEKHSSMIKELEENIQQLEEVCNQLDGASYGGVKSSIVQIKNELISQSKELKVMQTILKFVVRTYRKSEDRITMLKSGIVVGAAIAGAELKEGDKEIENNSLVTLQKMKEFGWNISDEELSKISNMLKLYNITNESSIMLFMATCGHESGKGIYNIEQGDNTYFDKKDYKITERGAGYIQITWKNMHLKFLQSVKDDFKGIDTATYIAKNYPWEAAGWFWSNSEAKNTPAGSLNDYVIKYGDSKGVFLITQYYINGWPNEFNKVVSNIRDGNVAWEIKNGKLYVENKEICRAPNGWEDRERNYDDAVKAFK